MSRCVISILVADRSGALSRIAEIFGSRGYNVASICSGSCEEENTQRLTIVCNESSSNLERIIKLLNNLVDVYEARKIHPDLEITRELLLAKIGLDGEYESLLTLLNSKNTKIIRQTSEALAFEFAGTASQIDDLCEKLKKYNILEMSRTGEAAIHTV